MIGALFEHRQYGRKIIVGLAGWNIRRAFEIFLEFARSGFIREEDIFQQQASNSPISNLSQGTVAKVLLRTNRRYYDGNASYIKNLFQVDPASPAPLPLLRYWILFWLRSKAPLQGPSGFKGYHRQGDLVHDLIAVGADAEAVRMECRYLAKAGCILPEHLRPERIDDPDLIAITPAGHVHLELAHQDINYLAACAEDAWLEDDSLAERLRQRISLQPFWRALSWFNTLESAADFCRYLDKIQADAGRRALFLAFDTYSPPAIRFQELLQNIKAHQAALAKSRTSKA